MIVAITGTIGAGKSSVANYFKDKGFKVFDSDKMVHQYYEVDGLVYQWLKDRYQDTILHEDKTLNRKALAAIVFQNEAELTALEEVVFPIVKEEILELKDRYKDETIFVEVPLLFEAKFEDIFDKIVVVDAFRKHRHHRLENKGFSKKDVLGREKRQYGSLYKKKHADIVINNNKDLDFLYKQLNKITKGGL